MDAHLHEEVTHTIELERRAAFTASHTLQVSVQPTRINPKKSTRGH